MSTRVLPGFTFFSPETLQETLALAGEHGDKARILAGGTDVLVDMKSGRMTADTVISIDRLSELNFIRYSDKDGLELGPLTTVRSLEKSGDISNRYPLLKDAASQFASVQVVNMATLGGNICNASPAGDLLPPLMAMNTELDLASADGNRTVKLTDFYSGPGACDIKPGEIVVRAKAPALPEGYGSSFVRFSRTAEDLAKVSVAALLSMDDGKFRDVRLSLGAVAPVPLRAFAVEAFLEGRDVSNDTIDEAARIALEAISPITDLRSTAAYRMDLTSVAVKRAITNALARGNAE